MGSGKRKAKKVAKSGSSTTPNASTGAAIPPDQHQLRTLRTTVDFGFPGIEAKYDCQHSIRDVKEDMIKLTFEKLEGLSKVRFTNYEANCSDMWDRGTT